jgi:hypothetical protein
MEFIKPEVDSLKWGMFSSLAFAAGASQAMLAATGHELYILNANNSSDKIVNFINEKELDELIESKQIVRPQDLKSALKNFTTKGLQPGQVSFYSITDLSKIKLNRNQ